ncbi:MAG: hypothetical protein HOK84_07085 [Bacteroidetes bacterium]|nr:hypothetical protein [Bacteroidota bacterium]
MFRNVFTLATLFCLSISIQAQNTEVPEDEAEKIKETALNYADGFLSGSGERMEKALFPDLQKLAPMQLPNGGPTIFIQATYSGLIGMSAAKLGLIPEDQRKIKVEALDMHENIACAKLTSSQFNDYLHMVKVDDTWKIVNVLWTWGADSGNRSQVPELDFEKEKPAIEKAARDLYDGVFKGDPDLVENCVIPRFSQASWNTIPGGGDILSRDGADLIVGVAKAKLSLMDTSQLNIEISVLDYMDGLATVKISSPAGVSYAHLIYWNGVWKNVNVLRKMKPRQR